MSTGPISLAPSMAGLDPAIGEGRGEGALENVLRTAALKLRAAGIDSPRMEARLLLAHVLSATREDVIAGRVAMDAQAQARFEDLLARRIAHEPIAYITGTREFWSLSFAVNPNVLIPRPESETLIEAALRHYPKTGAAAPLSVLDLGTGSGCLLLAFLSEKPPAQGLGIDASDGAIACATRNAMALGLENRAHFLCRNWSEPTSQSFDVVFANPPYLRSADLATLSRDVAGYEPRSALDGGEDGLDAYRELGAILPRLLNKMGYAFVELGQGQAAEVGGIFTAHGLDVEGFVNDLTYVPRCLVARRGQTRRRSREKKALEKEIRSG